MIYLNLSNGSFSNSIDIMGKSGIGLREVGYNDNIMTSKIFHNLGTYFDLKAALMRLLSFIMALRGNFLMTSPIIRSTQGIFLD